MTVRRRKRDEAQGQATLVTDRLRLEPLADEHLAYEVELDADPEVMRYLWGRARTPEEVTQAHGERLALGRQVDGLGLWAGVRRGVQPAEFVGLWMLTPSKVDGEAELGYRVRRCSWRQGYAGEGSGELLRHAFADLGLSRVYAQTMAVNVASRATMTSLGMRFVRVFHEHFDRPLPGTEQGEVEYEILRQDWLAAGFPLRPRN